MDRASGSWAVRGEDPFPGEPAVATVRGAMRFPIDDLLDETACDELLLSVLHLKGLH